MAISRALLSVSDKSNLVPFAKALADKGVELLSTGGTCRALMEAGIPVVTVEEFTGSPEVMDGRVKTLHPRVHGGILMRGEKDLADLEKLGGKPIDLVVVNLYPFEETLAKPDSSHELIVENIDIGGPTMLRSAAKNHARVAVVCDPRDYDRVIAELGSEAGLTIATRQELAAKVFAHTAAYDGAIAGYLSSLDGEGKRGEYPKYLSLNFERAYGLRYGENPHQTGAFYQERRAMEGSLALSESLGTGAKELSFNNLVDVHGAIEAVREFEETAAVVVKHTNPCGVAASSTDDLATTFVKARQADALSAFGGIVALNRPVDVATAKELVETFLEVVIAPDFAADALEVLHTKKRLRLLKTGSWLKGDYVDLDFKKVGGGLAVHARDNTALGEALKGEVVTERAPTAKELEALEFAWRVCKHVKSNAIVFAKPGRTVGVGAGQMSRVVSVQLAAQKAGDEAKGSAMASDAFFPFPDGIEAAVAHGVTAVVQPGGSIKDKDVIAAADKAGIAMVMTGVRHFKHLADTGVPSPPRPPMLGAFGHFWVLVGAGRCVSGLGVCD